LFITVLIGRVLIIALGLIGGVLIIALRLLGGGLNIALRLLGGALRELLVKGSKFFLAFSIGA
jgi:hypothetical protein